MCHCSPFEPVALFSVSQPKNLSTQTAAVRQQPNPPLANECEPPLKFSIGDADIALAMNNAVSATTMLHSQDMSQADSEILTVMEVARFLRVPKSTVYKLARIGELPASKIGKHWRFLRRDIHEWMHSRSQQA
jgi:excisionase family DNA binding protein